MLELKRQGTWKEKGIGDRGSGIRDQGSGMADVEHECMETTKQAMTECRHKRGA